LDRGGAGDRRGDARTRDDPGERDLGLPGAMARRHRVERSENAPAAPVQIFSDAAAARAFVEIGLAAVFARKEAPGEAVIGDNADLLAHAEVAQRSVEAGAVVEIVFGLKHLVARQLP